MRPQPTDEEIVAEIGEMIEAGDIKAVYLAAAKKIQGILKSVADRLSESVDGTKADTALIMRAIARKTEEALASVIYCVEGGHHYAATGLLRPICEELIFAKFLRSIPRTDADEYVRLRSLLDVLDGIQAQEDFFTTQQALYGWADDSDPSDVIRSPSDLTERIAEVKRKLKELGNRIGWGKVAKPSVQYMADHANATEIYRFFYHAVSSSVHASLHHLLRMVWYDQKTTLATITNQNFKTYYHDFSIMYGAWLASDLVLVLLDEFGLSLPSDQDHQLSVWMAVIVKPTVIHRSPPIVTRAELKRPDASHS